MYSRLGEGKMLREGVSVLVADAVPGWRIDIIKITINHNFTSIECLREGDCISHNHHWLTSQAVVKKRGLLDSSYTALLLPGSGRDGLP